MSSTSTTSDTQRSIIAVAIALPGSLLVISSIWLLAVLPMGVDRLWRHEPLTLAEAAALRDTGEIVRLISRGEDPNAAGMVRAEFLRHDAAIVTPLEAAVAVDRLDVLEVLLDNGATLDAATWARLTCFAAAIDADEARSFLQERRPAGAADSCDHVDTPW